MLAIQCARSGALRFPVSRAAVRLSAVACAAVGLGLPMVVAAQTTAIRSDRRMVLPAQRTPSPAMASGVKKLSGRRGTIL